MIEDSEVNLKTSNLGMHQRTTGSYLRYYSLPVGRHPHKLFWLCKALLLDKYTWTGHTEDRRF
jgi:hypothetical protein